MIERMDEAVFCQKVNLSLSLLTRLFFCLVDGFLFSCCAGDGVLSDMVAAFPLNLDSLFIVGPNGVSSLPQLLMHISSFDYVLCNMYMHYNLYI